MKQLTTAALMFTLAATPLEAQEGSGNGAGDMEEGFSLLEEGTKLLLRGLMSEMEPAIRELQDALRNLDAYHPPEVLRNGDIIIRRKQPVKPGDGLEVGPEGDVEL